jgi:hypothetical protein
MLSCLPFWWFLTPAAFQAMVRIMGFAVRETWTWRDHAQFLLCERLPRTH